MNIDKSYFINFTYPERAVINRALSMYKEYRPNEKADVDNIAVLVFRNSMLHQYQFNILYRAILIYTLTIPENTSTIHMLNSIIKKMKGIMNAHGLDRNERDEEEIG